MKQQLSRHPRIKAIGKVNMYRIKKREASDVGPNIQRNDTKTDRVVMTENCI